MLLGMRWDRKQASGFQRLRLGESLLFKAVEKRESELKSVQYLVKLNWFW